MVEKKFDIEHLIQVPKSGFEPVQPVEHMATIGENVTTCNFAVTKPNEHINEEVKCPKCGQEFKIIWQGDENKYL